VRRLALVMAAVLMAAPALASFDEESFDVTSFDEASFEFGEAAGVTVPSVIGMTQAEADTALEAVGLDTGAVATVCSAATSGDVVSQAPPAGASAPEGSLVNISLSSGTPCTGAGGKLKLRLDLRL
jgi:hypothetical protein